MRLKVVKLLLAGVIFVSLNTAVQAKMPTLVTSEEIPMGIPTDVVEELYLNVETFDKPYTEEDIDLIALVVLGEAEGESELGKRLVADTILNRVDIDVYPDNVHDVCWQKGQYGCLHNGRCSRLKVTDTVRDLVIEEMQNRTNNEVLYFNTGGYNGRHPLFQEGAHYFSGR